MIFQSFLLGNLVSLCTKIINSVVVVGLYYGFLTTFSIGPSYLFLLRAEVMEEGTEKKVSARTGFITGQLVMFISIYYAPLHLALGRPHTITVLALPYLLFHFFWNNHKLFLNYGPATRNSMRNFSIQCVFLNNLIFQLFNHFILPSSMLARLVNISMFRCNNKMLFVTSSFVGWLIGHILFMKWLGLVLVWIRQNHSIRSNILIRSNKYLVSELRNSMAQIFSILLFITCVYYLGRIPSPILTKKLKETSKTETSLPKKRKETDPNKIDEREEIQVNGKKDEFYFPFTEADSKNRPVSKEFYLMNQNENDDNSKFKIFDKKTQDKHPIHFYKPFVILLFDSKRWNRPSRYIKNNKFDKAVRNEMSQYFFDICQSDGNPRISFTYLSSLSFFFEIIKRKISSAILKKFSSNELYNSWVFTNKQKGKSFNNEFINRIEALDKESIPLNMFQIRTQLCNDDFTKEYLSKSYDPVLNGSYRRRIYKSLSRSILIKNFNKKFWINRIHVMLLPYTDSNQKISRFDKKPLSREIFTFSIQFIREPASINLNRRGPSLFSFSEGRKYFQYFLNTTETDDNGKAIRIKEINKKVPRWADNLITELEQESGEHEEDIAVDHEIRSRKAKRVVIFTTNKEDTDPNTTDPNTTDQTNEVALIRYSHQPDFRRGIIKGSIRAQRRKIEIGELFQANVHSPLFFNKIQKFPLFSFDISEWIKLIFRNWVGKEKAFKILKYRRYEKQTKIKEQKETKKKKEKAQIDIAEYWDRIPFAQVIRGSMLLTQSIFRKSILLPSLIISKNIGRIFLLQFPEWSEDFKEWNREIHVKCTYNGVPLSETEFPKNWLTDGIQIKIFFPFCLKPWHKSKEESSPKDLIKNKKEKDDFSFLTILGMEAELPFGSPRKRPSFFKPILKELEKKLRKFKKKSFRVFVQVLIVFKRKTKLLQKVLKEIKEWVIKRVCFLKKIIKEFFKGLKGNLIRLFRIREVEIYKLSQIKIKEEKYSMINNQIIHESSRQIASPSLKNCLLTERKMKDRTHRTNTLRDQIERISKEKVTPRMNNLSPKKTSYSVKRFKKWKVLKRRNARLMCKLSFFVKFFIERIYTDPILFIINSVRMNREFVLESTILQKSIYNNERKQRTLKKKIKIQFPFFRF
ncbi:protein TIC 214-like [Andrographis paniculata]|uniref:protein TIC 214-like n=1 Tax=Andrographis paniculata TaxID=175694 RepID=UPI0021E9262A|nr:protein TIC 214-like [Andrographis paniculata]